MSRWGKIALVCAGYLLALVAGSVASCMYNARMAAMPYDTSGGMYAAGDLMSGLGAFLVVAIVPTVLALWFLRHNRKLWQAIAIASLAFAGAGLLAVLMPLAAHDSYRSPALTMFGWLGLVQLLGVPLWTLAFAAFAFFAPTPQSRRLLVTAIGIELVIGACAAYHWFAPSPVF